jgi:hypothetical protein
MLGEAYKNGFLLESLIFLFTEGVEYGFSILGYYFTL